jgi:hypothetical protein
MNKTLITLAAALAVSVGSTNAAIFAVNFAGSTPVPATLGTSFFTPNILAADITNAFGSTGATINGGVGAGTTTSYSASGVAAPAGFNNAFGEGQMLSGSITGTAATDIVVTFSGLNTITVDYDVTVIASQNAATGFLSATLTYGSTTVNMPFTPIPPTSFPFNPGNVFGITLPVTGPNGSENIPNDSFTITIRGADTPGGIRNALSAIAVDYRPIPEPTSAALAGLAALGLMRRRRA